MYNQLPIAPSVRAHLFSCLNLFYFVKHVDRLAQKSVFFKVYILPLEHHFKLEVKGDEEVGDGVVKSGEEVGDGVMKGDEEVGDGVICRYICSLYRCSLCCMHMHLSHLLFWSKHHFLHKALPFVSHCKTTNKCFDCVVCWDHMLLEGLSQTGNCQPIHNITVLRSFV